MLAGSCTPPLVTHRQLVCGQHPSARGTADGVPLTCSGGVAGEQGRHRQVGGAGCAPARAPAAAARLWGRLAQHPAALHSPHSPGCCIVDVLTCRPCPGSTGRWAGPQNPAGCQPSLRRGHWAGRSALAGGLMRAWRGRWAMSAAGHNWPALGSKSRNGQECRAGMLHLEAAGRSGGICARAIAGAVPGCPHALWWV